MKQLLATLVFLISTDAIAMNFSKGHGEVGEFHYPVLVNSRVQSTHQMRKMLMEDFPRSRLYKERTPNGEIIVVLTNQRKIWLFSLFSLGKDQNLAIGTRAKDMDKLFKLNLNEIKYNFGKRSLKLRPNTSDYNLQ